MQFKRCSETEHTFFTMRTLGGMNAGQGELANAAMEEFVDVNYGYLNGNVEAMGKILRKFNDTFTNVTRLRKQVGASTRVYLIHVSFRFLLSRGWGHDTFDFQAHTTACFGGLVVQVSECKSALLEGLREQNIRQMWVRKKEHEYILHMLDRLEMLKDTPTGTQASIMRLRMRMR